MKNDIILTTGPLGGLGDHAIYTSLPERFAKQGHKVYVDADNLCRNDEISDLLWAHNPYIEGTTDRKPNAGYINQGRYYEVANRFPPGSIEIMERVHDLPPPYGLAPKIYYQPKPFHIDLSNKVLVDVSARSSALGTQALQEHVVTKMAERFAGKEFVMVTFPQGVLASSPPISGPSIRVNSIFEYVDAIAACHAIVCSEAGSQSLAAAVRGEHDAYDHAAHPEIVCISSMKTWNSRGYCYRGVDYRITADHSNTGEYWSPTEQPYQSYQVICRRSVEEARAEYAAARAARESADAAVS